jgi:hypothetical protein
MAVRVSSERVSLVALAARRMWSGGSAHPRCCRERRVAPGYTTAPAFGTLPCSNRSAWLEERGKERTAALSGGRGGWEAGSLWPKPPPRRPCQPAWYAALQGSLRHERRPAPARPHLTSLVVGMGWGRHTRQGGRGRLRTLAAEGSRQGKARRVGGGGGDAALSWGDGGGLAVSLSGPGEPQADDAVENCLAAAPARALQEMRKQKLPVFKALVEWPSRLFRPPNMPAVLLPAKASRRQRCRQPLLHALPRRACRPPARAAAPGPPTAVPGAAWAGQLIREANGSWLQARRRRRDC